MAQVENVEALPRWSLPRRGMVKINVHGCFFVEALPNGNVTGIGVVIRNSRGRILRMLSGSLRIQNRRVNEYYAMLEGCKRAYAENWEHYILESDHFQSYWEWRHSAVEGVHPDHQYVVQQLNQRRADHNFEMEVDICDRNANELAAFLADHGARNYQVMVVINQPFGRIFEIWHADMGLGPAEPQFMAVNEEDVGPGAVNDADIMDQPVLEEEPDLALMVGGDAQVNVDGEPVEVDEIQE